MESLQPPDASPDAFPVFKTGDVIIRSSSSLTFQLHSATLSRHSPWFEKTLLPSVDTTASSRYLFSLENVNGKITLVRQNAEGHCGHCPKVSNSSVANTMDSVDVEDEDEEDDDEEEEDDEKDEEDDGEKDEDVFDEYPNTHSSSSTAPSLESRDGTSISPARNSNPTARRIVTHDPRYHTAVERISFSQKACYTQIFGAIYNIPPQISTDNITVALSQAEKLVELATELGCVRILRSHLGLSFSNYGKDLLIAITKDPARWITLAISVKNVLIYKECLVHLIGAQPCWPWKTQIRYKTLPEDIQHLIRTKSVAIQHTREYYEKNLLSMSLPYSVSNGQRIIPLDPTQSSQKDTWITVQVFRDQLAQRIDELDRSKEGALHHGTFFRRLGKGTLDLIETDRIRGICEGTMNSNWPDLNKDIKLLRNHARKEVGALAGNSLLIDPDDHGIGYLTCAEVKDEDIPWLATRQNGS
jgi:hypothetical protein